MTKWPDGRPPVARRVFRYVLFYLVLSFAHSLRTLKSDKRSKQLHISISVLPFSYSLVEHLSRIRISTHR